MEWTKTTGYGYYLKHWKIRIEGRLQKIMENDGGKIETNADEC